MMDRHFWSGVGWGLVFLFAAVGVSVLISGLVVAAKTFCS